jgi:hypothetical protein
VCAESETVRFMLNAKGKFSGKRFFDEDFTLDFSENCAWVEAMGREKTGQYICTVDDKTVFCPNSRGLTINFCLNSGGIITSSAIGKLNGQSKPITISYGICKPRIGKP